MTGRARGVLRLGSRSKPVYARAVASPKEIELPDGTVIPILYEDRAVFAIDKPGGWLLAPESWDRTSRNLHLALMSAIHAGDYWARSRQLKFLRFVHRLDADTSGVLLLVKKPGAVQAYTRLFETRRVEKTYLAVVRGEPKHFSWSCRLKLASRSGTTRRVKVDSRHGREAETLFRVLRTNRGRTLIEARPLTGRTHQIRVHLASSGHPVLGDVLYDAQSDNPQPETRDPPFFPLALRAVALSYHDPFQKRTIRIEAPIHGFCQWFGF